MVIAASTALSYGQRLVFSEPTETRYKKHFYYPDILGFNDVASTPTFPRVRHKNVCTHGPNSTYWATHPKKVRRAIKYHFNIFTLGLSSVRRLFLDADMVLKYDVCSPISEDIQTAEDARYNTWMSLMRTILISFHVNLTNPSVNISMIDWKYHNESQVLHVETSGGNMLMKTRILQDFNCAISLNEYSVTELDCKTSDVKSHQVLIPCTNQTEPDKSQEEKDELKEKCCQCYPGNKKWQCEADGERQTFAKFRADLPKRKHTINCPPAPWNSKSNCGYFCECGRCWMDLKYSPPTTNTPAGENGADATVGKKSGRFAVAVSVFGTLLNFFPALLGYKCFHVGVGE